MSYVVPGTSPRRPEEFLSAFETFMDFFSTPDKLKASIAEFKDQMDKAKKVCKAAEDAEKSLADTRGALEASQATLSQREADIAKREVKVQADTESLHSSSVTLASERQEFESKRKDQDAYYASANRDLEKRAEELNATHDGRLSEIADAQKLLDARTNDLEKEWAKCAKQLDVANALKEEYESKLSKMAAILGSN